jgi:SulP family sulfate permease
VTVFRIHGPFLFGSAGKINEITRRIEGPPPIIIRRLRNMAAIDATGLTGLEELADALPASSRALILYGAREQPSRVVHDAEFERHVGRDNICADMAAAIDRAESPCRSRLAGAFTR